MSAPLAEQERLNGAPATEAPVEVPEKRCLWWNRLSTIRKSLIVVIIVLSVIILFLICLVIALAVTAKADPVKICLTRDCIESAGSLSQMMDPTLDPCEDFYQYACSGFLKENKYFSSKYPLWLPTLELREAANLMIKNVLEMPSDSSTSRTVNKMKLTYVSCLITLAERSERSSLKKLKEEIRKLNIGDWPNDIELDPVQLEDIIAMMQVVGSQHLFKMELKKIKEGYIYTLKEISSKNFEGYSLLVTELLELLEVPYPRQVAKEILALEKEITGIHVSSGFQDIFDIEGLSKFYPSFDWSRFFNQVFSHSGFVGNVDKVKVQIDSVNQTERLVDILKRTSTKQIRNYLMIQFVLWANNFLGPSFRNVDQIRSLPIGPNFASPMFLTHWEICQTYVGIYFDRALTAEYVRILFNDAMLFEIKRYMDNIKESFRNNIPKNDWLDDWTKKQVEDKINAVNVVIGYPPDAVKIEALDKRYEDVEIDEDNFLHNMVELRKNYARDELRHIVENIKDEKEWNYSPNNLNAFNNRNENLIIIPLSILYPPNFQMNRPKYLNYGAIGNIIGHEMGHSFDLEGIMAPIINKEDFRYLNWSSAMLNKYKDRAQCILNQYSNFVFKEFSPDFKWPSIDTINEDISDHVGLLHSYLAYKNYEKTQGIEPGLAGLNFTNDQIFFIQYAQMYCTSYTLLGANIMASGGRDIHSPGEFRVNGPITNNPYFGEIFNCPIGSPMNPLDKCELWV